MTKYILGALVIIGLAGSYFVGFEYPQIPASFGSPVGTTFNTAKVAMTNYTPSTSAASSTSILNTDASTRYIVSSTVACNGVNGQGGTFTFATTSVANEGLQGNTNYAGNDVATTTTSSTFMYVASSTEGVPTYTNRLWPSGTYLSIVDSTTNQGVCTVGVNYLGS